MMVADRFVQLDYLTNGRAMLGVGPGALVSDALMMGIDPVTQRPRMDEALGVIVRLLAGEVVTHEAEWFALHEARLQMLPVNGTLRSPSPARRHRRAWSAPEPTASVCSRSGPG